MNSRYTYAKHELGELSMSSGHPYPLGAHWDGRGVNFAVFSAHATQIEICLFDEDGECELTRLTLPTRRGEVFCGYLEGARPGLVYGLRAHGPYEPTKGHRFNANKLLIDPYARQLIGELQWDDALFGYTIGQDDLSFDTRDSAPYLPKSVVTAPRPAAFDVSHLTCRPLSEGLIYEGHLKGMTCLHPEVPPTLRGVFGGLASQPLLDHYEELGVTALELLPFQSFVNDRYLVDRGLSNYWGYQPINYFAPMPQYLGNGRLDELITTVRRLAGHGVELIMDVVYNHTGEGNELGPTLSFRGLDNASYYALRPDQPRYYLDDSGCGNRFNLAHPRVLQLVMDSLRYWHGEIGVAGFRFDLCTSLGRGPRGLDMRGGFFAAIRQDPTLNSARLIAEPWDVGPGGYQLGGYPTGWSEWNDRYRDTLRRFWRGDQGIRPELAKRICGSSALYRPKGRLPSSSINYLCSHDGVTLHDLVTYGQKRNLANGEDNRDGHHDDLNCHFGIDGEEADADHQALRRRVQRSLLTSLFLSRGALMLLAGDEMGRTQQGNNNAYCQDNDISWLSWTDAEKKDDELLAFTRELSSLRRQYPLLSTDAWLRGECLGESSVRDLIWLTPLGEELAHDAWGEGKGCDLSYVMSDEQSSLWIVMNASRERLEVSPPQKLDRRELQGASWRLILDSGIPDRRGRAVSALQTRGGIYTEGKSVQVWSLIRS